MLAFLHDTCHLATAEEVARRTLVHTTFGHAEDQWASLSRRKQSKTWRASTVS